MYIEFEKRSIEQHNYEWLCYSIIAKVTGHTAYEIYENMAIRILKVIDEDGDLAYIKPSSLSKSDHNLYMDQIHVISSEIGIILPDPTKDIARQLTTKKLLESIKNKDGKR